MLKIHKLIMSALAALVFVFSSAAQGAETSLSQQHMQACIKKAADLPDMAVAEANNWLKQGGGDAAILCRATAQFHNNEFIKSAQDFVMLAGQQKDDHQASLLWQQAALAWTRAEDYKQAEDAYSKAIRFEQQDPDLWVERANERAEAQRYWDAIDDLDKALGIMPDMPEALRLRGQVWSKLGLDRNAESDFRHAGEVQAEEDVANSNARKKIAITPSVNKVSDNDGTKTLRRGSNATAPTAVADSVQK